MIASCHDGMIAYASVVEANRPTDRPMVLLSYFAWSLVLICLKMSIFIIFDESVPDRRTDGWTNGPTDERTDGQTDGRTNVRTDRPSYRDARTHLKISIFSIFDESIPNGPTDGLTDGQTCSLIEMRGCIISYFAWPPLALICLKISIFIIFDESVTDRPTDGPTDGRMDRPTERQTSYRGRI